MKTDPRFFRRSCWCLFFISFFSQTVIYSGSVFEDILIYKHDQVERLQQQIKMYTTYIHIYIVIFKLVTSSQCSPLSFSRYFISVSENTAHCRVWEDGKRRLKWNNRLGILLEFFCSFLNQSHKLTVEGSHTASVFSWWPQIIRKDLADSSVPLLQTEWQIRNRGTAFGCVL